MTPLRKPLLRDLELTWRRHDLVVRIAGDGVYLKGRGQRWSSAVYLPWQSVYDVAATRKAVEIRRARAEARRRRK